MPGQLGPLQLAVKLEELENRIAALEEAAKAAAPKKPGRKPKKVENEE